MYIVISDIDNYKQTRVFNELESAAFYLTECARDNEEENINADGIIDTARERESENETCLYDTQYDNYHLLICNLILLKVQRERGNALFPRPSTFAW